MRTSRLSVLVWTQNIWHFDCVTERIFQKSLFLKKSDDKKILKNFPACDNLKGKTLFLKLVSSETVLKCTQPRLSMLRVLMTKFLISFLRPEFFLLVDLRIFFSDLRSVGRKKMTGHFQSFFCFSFSFFFFFFLISPEKTVKLVW